MAPGWLTYRLEIDKSTSLADGCVFKVASPRAPSLLRSLKHSSTCLSSCYLYIPPSGDVKFFHLAPTLVFCYTFACHWLCVWLYFHLDLRTMRYSSLLTCLLSPLFVNGLASTDSIQDGVCMPIITYTIHTDYSLRTLLSLAI